MGRIIPGLWHCIFKQTPTLQKKGVPSHFHQMAVVRPQEATFFHFPVLSDTSNHLVQKQSCCTTTGFLSAAQMSCRYSEVQQTMVFLNPAYGGKISFCILNSFYLDNILRIYFELKCIFSKTLILQGKNKKKNTVAATPLLEPKPHHRDRECAGEVPQTVTEGPKWPFTGH